MRIEIVYWMKINISRGGARLLDITSIERIALAKNHVFVIRNPLNMNR